MGARNPQEVLRLQTEFAQAQMKTLADQAKALGESVAEAGRATFEAVSGFFGRRLELGIGVAGLLHALFGEFAHRFGNRDIRNFEFRHFDFGFFGHFCSCSGDRPDEEPVSPLRLK
jgi:hypothetical protein